MKTFQEFLNEDYEHNTKVSSTADLIFDKIRQYIKKHYGEVELGEEEIVEEDKTHINVWTDVPSEKVVIGAVFNPYDSTEVEYYKIADKNDAVVINIQS